MTFHNTKSEPFRIIPWTNIILVSAVVFATLNSCNNPESKTPESRASRSNMNYKAAYFEDSSRLEKLKNAYPATDSMMRKFVEENHIPGLAYGIVIDGKLVHNANFGFSDLSKNIPVSSSTMFRVASMSKSVTAMAILRLRDQGKLSLEDKAAKYIPTLQIQEYATADAPEITIRHLLTHSAGFPEDNPWGDRQLADTDNDLTDLLNKKITFSNPPGVSYEYSNLGFALLGKIISVVSGKPYQQYIHDEIFVPLGMNKSGYEFADIPPLQLAHGYRWLNEKWNEEELLDDQPDGSWGAMGALISSVDEFSKYMALHLEAWPPSNLPDLGVLKRSSLREMHHPWRFDGMNLQYRYADGRNCPVVTAYCYGLRWMQDCDGKTIISHSGGLPGFGSHWGILPDYGIGIVTLANRTYAGVARINPHILDTLVKRAGLQRRILPPSDILEKRKNELVSLFPDWKYASGSGIFAENFFPDNPIDSLIKYSQLAYSAAGKIISVSPLRAENQLRGQFLINAENGTIPVYFTLSPENPALIQEFRMGPLSPTPKKQ
jgi:CubicO group peptidase (beta-lactamase class C family)